MCAYKGSVNSIDNNHYNYTVNLRLAPVENGIRCVNRSFYGLNAFNKYFQYLLPVHNGFSLPDVWDGYFHITLGKFWLNYDRNLGAREDNVVKYITDNTSAEQHYATVFPCKFQATELKVYSGTYRHDEAEGIDFVTLKVKSLDNKLENVYPFLEIIKNSIEKEDGQWYRKSFEDCLNDLHVTVRKYKENHLKWSTEFIQNCGILERVRQNPLEFECTALEITQTRRQARNRMVRGWWRGVTGISLKCNRCHECFPNNSPGFCQGCHLFGNNHKCSGCHRKERRQISWPGNCRACGQYECLKPLWSTNH